MLFSHPQTGFSRPAAWPLQQQNPPRIRRLCQSIRHHRRGVRAAAGDVLTPPLHVEVSDKLSGPDRSAVPIWGSFCGVSNGAWQGRVAAFAPHTGLPEQIWQKDPAKRELCTYVVEERSTDNDIDRIIRFNDRAPTVDGLQLPAYADQTAQLQHCAEVEAEEEAEQAASTAKQQPAGGIKGKFAAGDESESWQCVMDVRQQQAAERRAWEDKEDILEDEEGFVIYDGGTYSRGPIRITPEPKDASQASSSPVHEDANSVDSEALHQNGHHGGIELDASSLSDIHELDAGDHNDDEDEPFEVGEDDPKPAQRTSVIEQCLAYGSEQRLRLQLTLSVSGGSRGAEMQVEVLRVLLFREFWQGLPSTGKKLPLKQSTEPVIEGPRLSPRKLAGQWKVFDVESTPFVDQDPLTDEEKLAFLYFSRETGQTWKPDAAPGVSEDGAAIWLPNNVLVELLMTDQGASRPAGSKVRRTSRSPRGMIISFSWLQRKDIMLGVQRHYDHQGELTEIRNRTAVRGGWVGGQA
ncbi:hypothetical protein WJX74_001305 [Apatococcus lobatus]|uniref:Uncharacterized protein n=2 Tax=Apatococcus TaxID=904362 RepID=A0AAW1TCG6_9CHLO